jgi:hypothetical protein
MAHTALIAISFGLIVAAPTAITGLLDWLDLPKGCATHGGDDPPVRDGGGDRAVSR